MEDAKLDELLDSIASRIAEHPPRLALSIDDAARALGVKRGTIEGLINNGDIKAKLIGRHLRIPIAQLRKILK